MPRHFPDWITAYLQYTSESEAPDDFHFWTAVSVIAGATRRRTYFPAQYMGYFRWFPNFFILFVAPPGVVSKSTTADIGMSILRKLPAIKFGPSAVTWQALVTSLADAAESFPVSDGLFEPMSAITIVSSELGSLIQPGDAAILTALTDLWDGKDGVFEKITKGGGTERIENPYVNLLGCTTPSWIAENFTSHFIGGGFASRTIFVFADHKRHLRAYPGLEMDRNRGAFQDKLAEDLRQIAEITGPFQLDADAIEWGTSWYARHNATDNPLRADPRFGGYLARKQTHLHKVAMVLSLARRGTLRITQADLSDANEALSRSEPYMLSAFGQMNKEKIVEQTIDILAFVRSRGSLPKTDLYASFMLKMGYTTFSECLQGLIGTGLVVQEEKGGALWLRYVDKVERSLRGGTSNN